MTSPALLQGNVLEPAHISQPVSYPAHDFFNLVRTLVHKAGFHTEAEVLKALEAVTAFEKHIVPAVDQRHVLAETDHAPVEDVSQRVPPRNGLPAVAPGAQIDYARLAAAIVAAQNAQAEAAANAAPSEVHVVTDAPPA